EQGDEFIATRQLYGGSVNQFNHAYKKFGWNVVWADGENPQSIADAITDKTRAIFCESMANPAGNVMDLEAIGKIAKANGLPLIVDNTMASPYLCQPKQFGADIIIHSLTKFIGGQGNSIGGIIVDCGTFDWLGAKHRYKTLVEPNPSYNGMTLGETFGDFAFAIACRVMGLRDLGPAIAPMNAFLILQGVETLPLRMEKHCANALAVAKHLSGHSKVAWVNYAGLSDNPNNPIQSRICPRGAGAVFTFGLKGGFDAGVQFVEALQMFSHLANIGDTRSLVIHPASTTHKQLTDDERDAAGAGNDVVRLSIGIEDAGDIIDDLDQALAAV
ncbi:MAG: aminotransferase class V-fold PLP-dependent enzyme, partial [Pseudomonadota bacterium]